MDPMFLLLPIALTLAGSVGLLTYLAYQKLAARPREEVARTATGGGTEDVKLIQQRRSFPLANLLPLSRESEERTSRELERAGWRLRVNEYLSLRLASAVVAGVVGLLVLFSFDLGPAWLRPFLTILSVLVGWRIPRFLLSRARKKRLARIEAQLADSLLTIAKSLQVGSGFLQALSHAAKETPAPLGTELQRTLRELHLGGDTEDVFLALAERIGSEDMDIVVTAIVIQRNTGGNLSEILFNVSNTIRQRFKIREEVQTLTSAQRLTANFVALLPPLVVLAFMWMNPDFARLLTGTGIGQIALAIGITLEVFGYWMIKRLAVIEV